MNKFAVARRWATWLLSAVALLTSPASSAVVRDALAASSAAPAETVLRVAQASVATSGRSRVRAGRYERGTRSPAFPDGGRETGWLQLEQVSRSRAAFQLEVTMNPIAADDGVRTRNGVIEQGSIKVMGRRGRYESNEEGLGRCVLDFHFRVGSVDVVQEGRCWWFGEGVDASGRYFLTTKALPDAIR